MGQKLWRSPRLPWVAVGLAIASLFLLTPLRFLVQSRLGFSIPIRVLHQTHLLHNQPVAIAGQIQHRIPLIGGQIYELQDITGSVWVVSSNTALQPGQSVRMKGVVRFESIVIAGQEQGDVYLEERGADRLLGI